MCIRSGKLVLMKIKDLIDIFRTVLESSHSVPSWASSISLDSQTEEGILAFMRNFVKVLFQNSGTITLELKSEFGLLARVSIHHKSKLIENSKI